MSEELLPCPFCGSKRLAYSKHFINCVECGVLITGKGSQEEHIAVWNTRVDPCNIFKYRDSLLLKEIENIKTEIACSIDENKRNRLKVEYDLLNCVLKLRVGDD